MTNTHMRSLVAKVKTSMEELYSACRKGKISDIPKLHKRFNSNRTELSNEIIKKESDQNGRKA